MADDITTYRVMINVTSFPMTDELELFRILCIDRNLVHRVFGIVNQHYQECHEVMSFDEVLNIVKAKDQRDSESTRL